MVERIIERIVFYSRWLLAPMFVGLALGLVFLLVSFVSELVHFVSTDDRKFSCNGDHRRL